MIPVPNVKSMWRFGFCIASTISWAALAAAQPVPGRDLLEFPIATIAEAPPLATMARDGVWNPASILLEPGQRARIVASALDGSSEQGVTAQLVALAIPLGKTWTGGISVLRARVSDIPRTESDPQTIGSDIRYGVLLLSAALARPLSSKVDAGMALRYQRGEFDSDTRGGATIDGAIVIHSIGVRDLRIAASSFLMKTGIGDGRFADTKLSLAADLRALGSEDDMQLRGGYSASFTPSLAVQHYAFLSGRAGMLELNAGLLREDIYGNASTRSRLGVGLRSATLAAGLSREENIAGISPTYQVVITSYIKR